VNGSVNLHLKEIAKGLEVLPVFIFSLRKMTLTRSGKNVLLIVILGALAMCHPLLRTAAESYLKVNGFSEV